MLHTTDTQRIYKMVGGAPVWQATCADGICQPQSRPTTQSVIDAGPATPRNGASAVDQRGNVYLFVGGAPIWQDSCAAPVNCGTPVKVSSWSIDARDHMNRVPADGNLVQAKAGATDLPVAMTIGGALIPFADPQEVIDVGQGGNWQQRVVAISANSYNLLGFNPADGTLLQGTGGGVSGPVAMAAGGAFIPFADPQEVIDVGQGGNWASKVRAIPLRVFNARPRVPSDSTLIQGTGGGASSPVATIVGGARVDFASPQEVIDSGYSADWQPIVRIIPARAFNTMSTKIADGTRLKKAGSPSQGGIIGGASIDFHSMAELEAAGYGPRPMQVVPGRVWDALTTRIAGGTRIKDADSPSQAAIVGGAKIPFNSMEELTQAGYGDKPMQVVPGRVWDALTTRIADGTYVKSPDSAAVWLVSGGRRTSASQSTGVQVIPTRVLDAIPLA
ncbi:hypothetical protein [Planomonospora algeriensis]